MDMQIKISRGFLDKMCTLFLLVLVSSDLGSGHSILPASTFLIPRLQSTRIANSPPSPTQAYAQFYPFPQPSYPYENEHQQTASSNMNPTSSFASSSVQYKVPSTADFFNKFHSNSTNFFNNNASAVNFPNAEQSDNPGFSDPEYNGNPGYRDPGYNSNSGYRDPGYNSNLRPEYDSNTGYSFTPASNFGPRDNIGPNNNEGVNPDYNNYEITGFNHNNNEGSTPSSSGEANTDYWTWYNFTRGPVQQPPGARNNSGDIRGAMQKTKVQYPGAQIVFVQPAPFQPGPVQPSYPRVPSSTSTLRPSVLPNLQPPFWPYFYPPYPFIATTLRPTMQSRNEDMPPPVIDYENPCAFFLTNNHPNPYNCVPTTTIQPEVTSQESIPLYPTVQIPDASPDNSVPARRKRLLFTNNNSQDGNNLGQEGKSLSYPSDDMSEIIAKCKEQIKAAENTSNGTVENVAIEDGVYCSLILATIDNIPTTNDFNKFQTENKQDKVTTESNELLRITRKAQVYYDDTYDNHEYYDYHNEDIDYSQQSTNQEFDRSHKNEIPILLSEDSIEEIELPLANNIDKLDIERSLLEDSIEQSEQEFSPPALANSVGQQAHISEVIKERISDVSVTGKATNKKEDLGLVIFAVTMYWFTI